MPKDLTYDQVKTWILALCELYPQYRFEYVNAVCQAYYDGLISRYEAIQLADMLFPVLSK